jgi:hypothetical protein
MAYNDYIPSELQLLYEIYDYHHAAAILKNEFPVEFGEICHTLKRFRLTVKDITDPGGSESAIPKKFSTLLRPLGWIEQNLTAKMVVDDTVVSHGTHAIDYVKGRVAFDLEWNSKDQTFDRDLYAFRTYFEYDRISAGVLVTRSNDLDILFRHLGKTIMAKFGASTTHMGKLLPRLRAGRHDGCPILVFGIKRNVVSDAPKIQLNTATGVGARIGKQ